MTCNEYQKEVAVSQNIAGKHIDRVFTFDKVITVWLQNGFIFCLESSYYTGINFVIHFGFAYALMLNWYLEFEGFYFYSYLN